MTQASTTGCRTDQRPVASFAIRRNSVYSAATALAKAAHPFVHRLPLAVLRGVTYNAGAIKQSRNSWLPS